VTVSQPDLFGDLIRDVIPPASSLLNRATAPARHSDPETSHKAAAMPFRRNSQRHRLLNCYSLDSDGLTDEEAAEAAEIYRGCPWKRCSELREMGMIEPTGEKRWSTMGAEQRVCKITAKGLATLEALRG
jgi:hypothetical protein